MFKSLRIVDAPGSPTFGEACEPWVFDFVAAIFGALNMVFKEQEKRPVHVFYALTLMFTVLAVLFLVVAIGLIVVFPIVLRFFG